MMTMMMMMIDDMLSPYMYLPDVPAFRLLSALVCIGSCSAHVQDYLQVQCSCLRIENARERDPPCRSMPWGSHTGRTCLMSEFGGVFRLCRLQVMCRTQSHTHPHNHNHTLTPTPTPTPTLSLSHFDTAPTPPYTTLHHPEAARRGGDAILAQTSV